MNMQLRRRSVLAAFLILLVIVGLASAACSGSKPASKSFSGGGVTVSAVTAVNVDSSTADLSFIVENSNDTADKLVSASVAQSVASGAKIVSQDSTVTSSNTATVVIPAQASVSFGPNGSKVLLTGLVSPLKTGDTVVLSLGFVNAGVISVTAKVQSS